MSNLLNGESLNPTFVSGETVVIDRGSRYAVGHVSRVTKTFVELDDKSRWSVIDLRPHPKSNRPSYMIDSSRLCKASQELLVKCEKEAYDFKLLDVERLKKIEEVIDG